MGVYSVSWHPTSLLRFQLRWDQIQSALKSDTRPFCVATGGAKKWTSSIHSWKTRLQCFLSIPTFGTKYSWLVTTFSDSICTLSISISEIILEKYISLQSNFNALLFIGRNKVSKIPLPLINQNPLLSNLHRCHVLSLYFINEKTVGGGHFVNFRTRRQIAA